MASEMRVSWLQKQGMGSVLCWQGTCRGCGSSPQTPLNVELPQHRVRCRMFAEPKANTWAASPRVPCCQDCPNMAPPGLCKGQLYPHKLHSLLLSTATPQMPLEPTEFQQTLTCLRAAVLEEKFVSNSCSHFIYKSLHIPLFCISLLSSGHRQESAQGSFTAALHRARSGACSPFGLGAQRVHKGDAGSDKTHRQGFIYYQRYNLNSYRFSGHFCAFLSFLCGSRKLCCLRSIYSGFPKGKCAANKGTGMQKNGSCFRTVRETLLQTNEPSICSKTLFSKHSMKTVILPGWSLEER